MKWTILVRNSESWRFEQHLYLKWQRWNSIPANGGRSWKRNLPWHANSREKPKKIKYKRSQKLMRFWRKFTEQFSIECRKSKTKVFAWLLSTLNWKPLQDSLTTQPNSKRSKTKSKTNVIAWLLSTLKWKPLYVLYNNLVRVTTLKVYADHFNKMYSMLFFLISFLFLTLIF